MRLDVGDPGRRASRWLSAGFSPLPDDGYVAVVRDITDQKRLDDERTDQIAILTHELRTPLSPIRGFLDELTDRTNKFTLAQRRHMYDVMLREEQRLERNLQQLLRATSLEQAEAAVLLEKLDWDAVVREQVEILQRQHAEREFSIDIDPELPPVIADDQLAVQVLANLLWNAVTFSPETSAIEIQAVRARERVVTTVADHGPGIPYGDRDRIFEKFTRLGDQSSDAQGVGLGLYIVRRSVETMGGTVWVDETDGGGASFTFSLPTEPVAPARLVRTR
jgi:K+-sensing histidine kinase KdpD